MRRALTLSTLALVGTLLLAGCAQQPAPPAPAAEALAPPRAAFACPEGAVVTGFDAAGEPQCRGILELAEDAWELDARDRPSAPQPAAKSLALSSASALADGAKRYFVASASAGLKWSDLAFTVNGTTWSWSDAACGPGGLVPPGSLRACAGTVGEGAEDSVTAGDEITIAGVERGQALRILDTNANSVVLTLMIA